MTGLESCCQEEDENKCRREDGDGIMNNFKALKNKLVQELVQFIKEIARNETYQNIGRELLKVVVEINKRAISGNLN